MWANDMQINSYQFCSVPAGIGRNVKELTLGGTEWPLKVSRPNSGIPIHSGFDFEPIPPHSGQRVHTSIHM